MRELKFRAWVDEFNYYTFDIQERADMAEWFGHPTIHIEQYTGLRDRGVEIYEGDILRWVNSTGREITAPVVWNTRAWCWTAGDYMLGGLLEFDLEVVGNIHEDLKLLEAK